MKILKSKILEPSEFNKGQLEERLEIHSWVSDILDLGKTKYLLLYSQKDITLSQAGPSYSDGVDVDLTLEECEKHYDEIRNKEDFDKVEDFYERIRPIREKIERIRKEAERR